MKVLNVNRGTVGHLNPLMTSKMWQAFIKRNFADEISLVVQQMTNDEKLTKMIVDKAINQLSEKEDFCRTRYILKSWLLTYVKYYTLTYLQELGTTKYISLSDAKKTDRTSSPLQLVKAFKDEIKMNFSILESNNIPMPAA